MTTDTLQIDPRHNGPRTSGNGGWVAGAPHDSSVEIEVVARIAA